MKRAMDVMTRSVATVSPDTNVDQVAGLMRDLNIGDVVVMDGAKIVGIVTDRDLAIQALPNQNGHAMPVKSYMSKDVVTGDPDWTLEQVADVMGKHQIRRLPIVANNQVVGIVSLGDVAVHMPKSKHVASSLNEISEASGLRNPRVGRVLRILGFAVPVFLTGVVVLSNAKARRRIQKELTSGELPDKARDAAKQLSQMLQTPETARVAWQAIQQADLTTKTLAALDTMKQNLPKEQLTQMASQVQKNFPRKKQKRLMRLRSNARNLLPV